MVNATVEVLNSKKTTLFMKATLKTIKKMEQVDKYIMVVKATQVNLRMINTMDKVFIFGLKATNTQVNG